MGIGLSSVCIYAGRADPDLFRTATPRRFIPTRAWAGPDRNRGRRYGDSLTGLGRWRQRGSTATVARFAPIDAIIARRRPPGATRRVACPFLLP